MPIVHAYRMPQSLAHLEDTSPPCAPQAAHNTQGARKLLIIVKRVDRALTRLALKSNATDDVDEDLKV